MKELFKKLIEVRDVSQQMHWNKSESGFNHESLEEFYTALLESTDLFVEVYSAQYGLIEDFGEFNKVDYSDKVKYFEEFVEFIKEKRNSEINTDNKHFDSLFDEMIISTYKLIYKLKYLG
jgi:DNA-binding ferritin-like protein